MPILAFQYLHYNCKVTGLTKLLRKKKYEILVVRLAGRGGGEEEVFEVVSLLWRGGGEEEVYEVVCDCWERRRGPRNVY